MSRITAVTVASLVLGLSLAGCSVVPATTKPAVNVPSLDATSTRPTTTSAEATAQSSAEVATGFHKPAVGSAERDAILAAFRVPVAKDLGQPVVFKVTRLNVENGFAFVMGTPMKSDGSQIDFSKTKYAAGAAGGEFDAAGTLALLKFENGKWVVLDYAVGATDFPAQTWAKDAGAPQAITTTE